MLSRSEEFLAHAAECEALATYWGDLIKEQYEQLARQWLFLAAQAQASEQCLQRVYGWTNVCLKNRPTPTALGVTAIQQSDLIQWPRGRSAAQQKWANGCAAAAILQGGKGRITL